MPDKLFPISLIIDDPAPLVHVYREHATGDKTTAFGEKLVDCVPNDFLDEFCDVVEEFGISGKFSVVPMPGCRGDIVNGLDGFDMKDVRYWIDTVNKRLSPYFDFCPEILTHHKAVDLATGEFLEMNEMDWAADKDRTVLTPYIARALELLRDAGIRPTGVTSPWAFGASVEGEYAAAIGLAYKQVFGVDHAWYFLNNKCGVPDVRPEIMFDEDGIRVVSVLRTIGDPFWRTINSPETSDAYINEVADKIITADGKSGDLPYEYSLNSYPIICTHWQSLFSNGRRTGLKALREVAHRVREHYSDKLVWRSFTYLTEETLGIIK